MNDAPESLLSVNWREASTEQLRIFIARAEYFYWKCKEHPRAQDVLKRITKGRNELAQRVNGGE